MSKSKVIFFLLFGLIGAFPAFETYPAAVDWPTKDITVIVPFSPGGGYDIQSRIFAPLFERYLPKKANVIISNQGGAGGKIGSIALIKSAPNGYTVGTMSVMILALMQVRGEIKGFDMRKLTWLGQLSWDPGAALVSAASGFKTVQDLTRREVRLGTTNDSLVPNVLLARRLGLRYRLVFFEGSSDEILAAMRGDVDLIMDSWPTMKRAVSTGAGKLVPLFVAADNRLPQWTGVPSSKELGLNLAEIEPMAGSVRLLAAPSGIPSDLRAVMEKAVWAALKDPEFKVNMEKAGYDATNVAPAAEAVKTAEIVLRLHEENRDILEAVGQK
jgi:tripartite-type tricarboxylate transporter receptor subunit TctC